MKSQLLSSLLGTYFSVLITTQNNKYTNLYLIANSILNLFDDELLKENLKQEYKSKNIAEFEYMLMSSGIKDNYNISLNKTFLYNDKEYSLIDILIILNDFLFYLNDLIITLLASLEEDISFDLSMYETNK